MGRWMDGWMYGWMDGWVNGWMDGWMGGCGGELGVDRWMVGSALNRLLLFTKSSDKCDWLSYKGLTVQCLFTPSKKPVTGQTWKQPGGCSLLRSHVRGRGSDLVGENAGHSTWGGRVHSVWETEL